MSKYNFDLDLITENPVKIIVDKIQPNSKILEFGPAHGRLTKYLNESMNCVIDIIEIDQEAGTEASKYANKALVGTTEGNADGSFWFEALKHDQYDYIVFADVLEHLRDPKEVLRKCRQLLNNSGSVLISVPNLAHNSVLISLYNNKFEYNKIGLLDNTHIHFFNYYSLTRMITECEFICVSQKATFARVGEIEIANSYDDVPDQFAKELMKRPYGNLYSFIFEIKKRESVFVDNVELISALNLDQLSHYKIECYIQNDELGFSEGNKITKFIRTNNNEFRFKLTDFKDIEKIMIKPINCNALLTIQEVYYKTIDGKQSMKYTTDALKLGNNQYIFKESQMIHLDGMKDATELVLNLHFGSYDLPDLNTIYDAIHSFLEEKNIYICEINNSMEEKNNYINDMNKSIEQKNEYIHELESVVANKNQYSVSLEKLIKEKDEYNVGASKLIEDKESQLEAKAKALQKLQDSYDELSEKYKKLINELPERKVKKILR